MKKLAFNPPKGLIIFVLILGLAFLALNPLKSDHKTVEDEIPLVLSSGLVSATQAQIEILLHIPEYEKRGFALSLLESLAHTGWSWESKEQMTGDGSLHLLVVGSYRATSAQAEKVAYRTYQQLVEELKPYQGKVFLHERVDESVDPAVYLSQVAATPKQWAVSGNTLSIAAQSPAITDYVIAGSDPINIQVLSRRNSSGAMTLVAVPVLLAEL